MENNPLLEALNAAKTGNTLPLFQWKENTICEKMIADIEGILQKQREVCAESASLRFQDGENEIDNNSILNAKLI